MSVLLLALGSAFFYLLAYHSYGRWLGKKIFDLSTNHCTPAIELEDGQDYVPTNKSIVFGHHFTSIAGTGPIVGPALAVIWGWLPALIWVLFGSIFIGAVHDFGSLVISMRHRGATVGEIAGTILSKRTRLLFLLILALSLTIVLAIFGLVIAAVFRTFPESITPCLIQIPLAIMIGLCIHQRGKKLLFPSLITLALMYGSVIYGNVGFLGGFNQWLASQSNMWWVSTLLLYSYMASVLPVWTLLQPRDYINSLQLLTTVGLVLIGLIIAGLVGGAAPEALSNASLPHPPRPTLELVAPALSSLSGEVESLGNQLPKMMPFLFITIACGAISGFHCLVCSGTSSKQIRSEPDARLIGYGSMLTEGFLAILVILACSAGLGLGVTNADGLILTGKDAWLDRYETWGHAQGLAAKIAAFVDGSANFLRALGFSSEFSRALMGVFVASFAATTLDTACRLQRYVIQELTPSKPPSDQGSNPNRNLKTFLARHLLAFSTNKYGATLLGVSIAYLLALAPLPGSPWAWEHGGKGGLLLWPLFGATNQLLAGLAFLVILFWLRQKNKPFFFLLLPAFFMLLLPAWAMLHQIFIAAIGSQKSWIEQGNWLVVSLACITLILEAWILIEAFFAWRRPSQNH